MNENQIIGRNMKALREANSYTQEQVAAYNLIFIHNMSAFIVNDVAKLYQIIEFCKFCHGKRQDRMPFLWECYIWDDWLGWALDKNR